MIDWWKKVVFENYANFNGRANRSEYWYFTLFNLIIAIAPLLLSTTIASSLGFDALGSIGLGVYVIVLLGTLIPSLSVAVRRLHDLDKSGSWLLFYFVPFIGGIMLLVWFCSEGTIGNNKYGRDPNSPEDVVFDFEKEQLEQQ